MKTTRTIDEIKEKAFWTVEEAVTVTGIGTKKLREISNSDPCTFVLWNGAKRLFKRDQFLSYLNQQIYIYFRVKKNRYTSSAIYLVLFT